MIPLTIFIYKIFIFLKQWHFYPQFIRSEINLACNWNSNSAKFCWPNYLCQVAVDWPLSETKGIVNFLSKYDHQNLTQEVVFFGSNHRILFLVRICAAGYFYQDEWSSYYLADLFGIGFHISLFGSLNFNISWPGNIAYWLIILIKRTQQSEIIKLF